MAAAKRRQHGRRRRKPSGRQQPIAYRTSRLEACFISLLYCLLFEKEKAEEGRRPPRPPGPSEPAWLPRMPASVWGDPAGRHRCPTRAGQHLRHNMTHGRALQGTLGLPLTCS